MQSDLFAKEAIHVQSPGFVQDFDVQIQGAFKDYSRTKINILKELYINIHSACVNTQEAQNTKNETFLGIFLLWLSSKFLLDISINHFLCCLLS